MDQRFRIAGLLWLAATTVAALTACGGGSGTPAAASPPSSTTPPSTTTPTPEPNKIMSAYPASWGAIFNKSTALPANYDFGRKTTTLAKGSTFAPNTMPLPCDIQWDRDVPVTLRDGVKVYTDVLRAANGSGKVPALVAWSPYGKQIPQTSTPGGQVPSYWTSGLQKFEGPDPAYWACNGYAVVNPDPRGTNMSEGNIMYWGSVDAGDAYDVIEWIAGQDWSNGKVGLHGTSWLAIAQWFIAAAKPPHLAAISPWNGFSDVYREHVAIGGIPSVNFINGNAAGLNGNNTTEYPGNYLTQVSKGLMNAYWDDKAAKVEDITIPAYVAGDLNTSLHPPGLSDAFRRLGSAEKWLRLNDTNEWYDQYTPASVEDLRSFFDKYLKGIDNGWEMTPRVRVSVLDGGGTNKNNVPYSSWPVEGTAYQKLYLDATAGALSTAPVVVESTATNAVPSGKSIFTITFTQDTQLVGYLKARLYVEANGADDMDLNVAVAKLDANGNVLYDTRPLAGYNASGQQNAAGKLRVSLRELDATKSTDYHPVGTFRNPQKLMAGQVVPVDIAIMPWAQTWHAGQKLQLTISPANAQVNPVNAGSHIVHTGGQYSSYLQIPVVPVSK